jgi:uncharacterized membrane-anchored protein YhcB (DUF1043 family)
LLGLIFGLLVGVIVGVLIKTLLVRRQRSSGTIYVTHDEEKTLYSLELEEYPESIAFKKKVVFKVDASEDSLNRE